MAVDQSASVSVKAEEKKPEAVPAAESADSPKVGHYLCKLGREVRTLKVDVQGGKCLAYYTKEGKTQTIGNSMDENVCFAVIEKVKKNLVIGDWNCRDVSGSRTTTIGE